MSDDITRKALFAGNNKYPNAPLRNCVRDAEQMKDLLKKHENGDPNFYPVLKKNLTTGKFKAELERLFGNKRKPQHALFYYSGHGYVNDSGIGYIVGTDYTREEPGVSMDWLFELVNQSEIPEITIILDCCFAGNFGSSVALRENVTLLAATGGDDTASEGPTHGYFTEILLKGLEGAAADVFGNITTTSLYNLADTTFTPWQQRPIYKAHISRVSALRRCGGGLSRSELRKLNSSDFFPDIDRSLGLRPNDVPTDYEKQPRKVEFFCQLQRFEKAGLVECPEGYSLQEAARKNSEVRLSVSGRFYCELVSKGKL